jgi:membrane-bound serine protease (ClpP class)
MIHRLCFIDGLLLLGISPAAAQEAPHVVLLDIQGPIGPATSDYIHRSLESAKAEKASLIILRMDTPGGLDLAMRDIIQDILASPVPVAGFVAPPGARAASAGTYILYASHIAAMAPATTLGAATPVQVGGPPIPADPRKTSPPKPKQSPAKKPKSGEQPQAATDPMQKKMINDAAAYIRGLALLRHRNAKWAEQAVREAVSLSAEEAVKKNVVNFIARDVPDLVEKVHGRTIETRTGKQKLNTRQAVIIKVEPDWRTRLLSVITNPNVAYILMLLGIYGLFFELANPGFVLPGVIGGICLLLALFAFQALPVNYAGLGLMILGIAFMVGEVFAPSFGALGIGGVIAFAFGSIILMDTGVPGFELSILVIATITITTALFFILVVGLAIKARKRPVVSGAEEIIGAMGSVRESFETEGRVLAHGEIWQAKTDTPLKKGQAVVVTDIDGLYLIVKPVPTKET